MPENGRALLELCAGDITEQAISILSGSLTIVTVAAK